MKRKKAGTKVGGSHLGAMRSLVCLPQKQKATAQIDPKDKGEEIGNWPHCYFGNKVHSGLTDSNIKWENSLFLNWAHFGQVSVICNQKNPNINRL